MKIQPSAGMLWPEARAVTLAGREWSVEELRVRDVASLEIAFADLAGHPHKGYEESLAVMANKAAHSREEVIHHGMLLPDGRDWPPRMGSARFGSMLCTFEGFSAFLWVVLARSNPGFGEPDLRHALEHATRSELADVERIAWGYQPWEDVAGDADGDDGHEAGGYRWSEIVAQFFAMGHSHESIAAMPLTQFLNATSGGEPRRVRVRPLSPAR